ncbi:glycosyltransferase [Sphaerotilus mobilis]|uniref:Glycosyltransferase involved in cell wall biosynthesis n=1 Tax=Sphaerotilus mobilis TaxID=47994 RepID=A0A4V2EV51_9BURK|nr:glycosyltransferase [Sphaerotilus mobilis]RZS47483.1 glycosyltransferase involved in cell wall biosynthesis [Sphaerotilus mobilis]
MVHCASDPEVKILIVSYSDSVGGAGRAAYRLHKALLAAGHQSRMRVRLKKSDDPTVIGDVSGGAKAVTAMRWRAGYALNALQDRTDQGLQSTNWLPSSWADEINASDADVVNLHWICGETMSISDIGRIKKPVAWTLHDMWPFCGSEHYTSDSADARWAVGYRRNNRDQGDTGWDLARWTAKRKAKAWRRPMHIISPSNWLGSCARRSELFRDWPVHVIPNPLDTEVFRPLDRHFARDVLRLPQDKKIVLFGAIGGSSEPRKGYQHLRRALDILANTNNTQDFTCVVFGQSRPPDGGGLPIDSVWTGHVSDDTTLALLYNSADVMVVPSEQENLPQTATEAQACGCPVVAFDCTGIPDVVIHGTTGLMASAYDPTQLASAIFDLCRTPGAFESMSAAARTRAVCSWSETAVAREYISVFSNMTHST